MGVHARSVGGEYLYYFGVQNRSKRSNMEHVVRLVSHNAYDKYSLFYSLFY